MKIKVATTIILITSNITLLLVIMALSDITITKAQEISSTKFHKKKNLIIKQLNSQTPDSIKKIFKNKYLVADFNYSYLPKSIVKKTKSIDKLLGGPRDGVQWNLFAF
jgi:hypothetical protein